MKKKNLSLLISLFLLSGCGEEEIARGIRVSKYVSDVSQTAPYLIAGKDEGEDVDYVISSYPVIFAAMNNENKKTDLKIYADIGKQFGDLYGAKGFPQAALFMKKSLEEDPNIKAFLAAFDEDVEDLIAGGEKAVSFMNAYSADPKAQQSRFGFASGALKGSQKNNGLAFISNSDNPTVDEINRLSEKLSISFDSEAFSSLYKTEGTASDASYSFKVRSPQGAPSAALARYASDENTDFLAAAQMPAQFVKKEADFILFDSVNGSKLSKANGGEYKIVRMVTFGNLYLMSTGDDEDGKLGKEDYIVGYGENLVPDLAFKAVYGEE